MPDEDTPERTSVLIKVMVEKVDKLYQAVVEGIDGKPSLTTRVALLEERIGTGDNSKRDAAIVKFLAAVLLSAASAYTGMKFGQ